jgi:bifunctional non-homologous end joining protein LigD
MPATSRTTRCVRANVVGSACLIHGQDGVVATNEVRDGVELTHLDQPLFDGAEATKRELVDYLDAVADRIIPALTDRPLSVIRVLPGQRPFMQKNLPKYTPPWVPRVQLWAESAKRDVTYALCNDRATLLWFANQRAVEFHPALSTLGPLGPLGSLDGPTHLVLDIDPPEASFRLAVAAAHRVRQALADVEMVGAVKTSGAKGLHVFVPVTGATSEEVASATRALAARAEQLDPALATTAFVRADRGGKVFLDSTRAGGATVVAVYSPRLRDGLPVSYPVSWDDLDSITPSDFTIRTAPGLLSAVDPWAALMPAPQQLSSRLVEEGRLIPIARVQAMHEGKRRAAQARKAAAPE